MDLTHDEHQLLLEGLWVLSVTRVKDDPQERAALEALAWRLGSDLDATYSGPPEGSENASPSAPETCSQP